MAEAAPEPVSLPGIGTDSAATLLIVAGDNPQKLGSGASFASLCGVSPIEASSGKVVRHRLNRGGNRQANGKPTVSQPRAVHDMPNPDAQGWSHAGVRIEAHAGGREQARDHPLSKALHRQGGLPRARLLRRHSSPTGPREEAHSSLA